MIRTDTRGLRREESGGVWRSYEEHFHATSSRG